MLGKDDNTDACQMLQMTELDAGAVNKGRSYRIRSKLGRYPSSGVVGDGHKDYFGGDRVGRWR